MRKTAASPFLKAFSSRPQLLPVLPSPARPPQVLQTVERAPASSLIRCDSPAVFRFHEIIALRSSLDPAPCARPPLLPKFARYVVDDRPPLSVAAPARKALPPLQS